MLRRLGRDGRQLRRARADGPQANPQGGQPGANPGCDPNCQSNDCSKGGDNGQQYYDADYTVVDDDKK